MHYARIAVLILLMVHKSWSAVRPSDLTRELILQLENEERLDTKPALSFSRIFRANKLFTLRTLLQSQVQTEQRFQQFLIQSQIVTCIPLWQLTQMQQELAATRLKLLLKTQKMNIIMNNPIINPNALTPNLNQNQVLGAVPPATNPVQAAMPTNAITNPVQTQGGVPATINQVPGAVPPVTNQIQGQNAVPANANQNQPQTAGTVNTNQAMGANNVANRNPNQSVSQDASSADSDDLEADDNQTEEDDSESPTDDSNQSSDDNSAGDPDNS